MVFSAGAAAAGMAFGAGRGAIQGGIVIGARLRAIDRFKALSAAIAGSNNALIRFGRTGLIASGQIAVFSAAMKLLVNPITGLLALLELGLGTRNWLIFERATRRAQVQLRLMNLTVGESNERINTFRRILGATTAAELFNSQKSFGELNTVTEDWRLTITELAAELKLKTGVDIEAFTSAAARGSKNLLSGAEDLRAMFPKIDPEKLLTGQELLQKIAEIVGEEEVTNMESFNNEVEKLQDSVAGPTGSLTDAMTQVGDVALEIINGTGGVVMAVVDGVDAALAPVDNALTTFVTKAAGDMKSILNPFEGQEDFPDAVNAMTEQWSEDMETWKDTFIPKWMTDLLGKFTKEDGLNQQIEDEFLDTFGIKGDIKKTLDAFKTNVWEPFMEGLTGTGGFDINLNATIHQPGEFPEMEDYAHGGIVPGARGQARMAIVHGGERVLPAGQASEPMVINLHIGEKKVDTIVIDSLTRTARFRSGMGARSMFS